MKPREFWIVDAVNGETYVFLSKSSISEVPKETIHVREFVPIDWEKVWDGLCNNKSAQITAFLTEAAQKTIQQLVEKQLAGEE